MEKLIYEIFFSSGIQSFDLVLYRSSCNIGPREEEPIRPFFKGTLRHGKASGKRAIYYFFYIGIIFFDIASVVSVDDYCVIIFKFLRKPGMMIERVIKNIIIKRSRRVIVLSAHYRIGIRNSPVNKQTGEF